MGEKEKSTPPIPVEWVKAKADESYKDGTLYRFNVLCWLLDEWEHENDPSHD